MTQVQATYLAQVNEINRLMQRLEPVPTDGRELIARIRSRSARVYQLLQSNNDLVKRQILPMLEPSYPLSQAEYDELNAFAEELCTYSHYVDASLAFHVRKRLLDVAEQAGDAERVIAQCYALGIASFLLCSEYEMFESLDVREKVVGWFHKGAAYLDRFETLSHDARLYVLRCLHNETLIFNARRYDQLDDYMDIVRRNLALFTSPTMRALEPTLGWDAYVRATYRNCLRISDAIENGFGLQYIDDVRQAAGWLTDHKQNVEEPSEIDQYSALELKLILHQISDEQCVEQLDAIFHRRQNKRYDRQGINQNVNIPSFSLLHEARLSPPQTDRMNGKIRHIIRYVNEFHRQTGLYSYQYAVANFIRYYPDVEGVVPFRHVLEKLMLALHVPTYVHSGMVSRLSVLIARAMLEACPDAFVGLMHVASAEEAEQRKGELLEFIRLAGLFHDVGKFYCLDVITQYSRRLFDDEFDIIKLHAECGYSILSLHASTAAFAEVALMHHITYDRQGGYERRFMPVSETVPIVSDIVRIADSIDAATDNIGRCYAACKTLPVVMDELIGSPKSYHPRIVSALCTSKTQRRLERMLTEGREKIYEQAYSDR